MLLISFLTILIPEIVYNFDLPSSSGTIAFLENLDILTVKMATTVHLLHFIVGI